MSYQGGRRPNLSQYIANLNTLPATSPEYFDEAYAQNDLNLFATAQFFDFDMAAGEVEELERKKKLEQQQAKSSQQGWSLDSLNTDYDFDYASILGNISEVQHVPPQLAPAPAVGPPQHTTQYPSIAPQPQHILPATSSTNSPTTSDLVSPTHKRNSSVLNFDNEASTPGDFEDASRGAADEDKRRRNTAASARFRIKKKQREQAMENHARDLEDKCRKLEGRVGSLEMENKWLRSLITDKKDVVLPVGKDAATAAPKEEDSRIVEAGKKGVGTA